MLSYNSNLVNELPYAVHDPKGRRMVPWTLTGTRRRWCSSSGAKSVVSSDIHGSKCDINHLCSASQDVCTPLPLSLWTHQDDL